MPRQKQSWYEVMPRYTCGSPAMVKYDTAVKVLLEEQRAMKWVLMGYAGVEAQQRAEQIGMRGIVWSWMQTGKGVRVYDMGAVEQRDFRTFDEYRAWTKQQREARRVA